MESFSHTNPHIEFNQFYSHLSPLINTPAVHPSKSRHTLRHALPGLTGIIATGKQPKLFQDVEDWKEYRFSLMITNDTQLKPEEVWRAYRPRANDENVIKDLKEGYGFASFNTSYLFNVV